MGACETDDVTVYGECGDLSAACQDSGQAGERDHVWDLYVYCVCHLDYRVYRKAYCVISQLACHVIIEDQARTHYLFWGQSAYFVVLCSINGTVARIKNSNSECTLRLSCRRSLNRANHK